MKVTVTFVGPIQKVAGTRKMEVKLDQPKAIGSCMHMSILHAFIFVNRKKGMF